MIAHVHSGGFDFDFFLFNNIMKMKKVNELFPLNYLNKIKLDLWEERLLFHLY